MKRASALHTSAAATGMALVLYTCLAAPGFAQPTRPAVSIGANDLGGTVRRIHGPEAGVWVIAETTDLPTKFTKIAKWMDGRIDDPNGGWKGKGIWSTFSTRAMVHVEGGKGTRPKVVKFQLRPDPLAR